MPSATTNGYPFPVGTDRVMDGDNAIQALAEAADAKAGIGAAGLASVIGASGAATAVLAVVFPVGRFTVPPVAVASIAAGGNTYIVTVSSVTAAGFNLTVSRRAGDNFPSGITVAVSWVARSVG